MNNLRNALIVVATLGGLISLTGCLMPQNGYAMYYQDKAGAGIKDLPPYSGKTEIYRVSDANERELKNWMRKGYVIIGESRFYGPQQSDSALRAQARKIGADVVLVTSSYHGSVQTAVPLMQYT